MILILTYPHTHEIPRGYGYLPTDTPTKEKPVSIPITYAPTGFSSWVRNPDRGIGLGGDGGEEEDALGLHSKVFSVGKTSEITRTI